MRINKLAIIKSVIAVIVLIIMYLFALNGRYSQAEGAYYFDKWKGCIIKVPIK